MISEETRLEVLDRDSWQCQKCGAQLERGMGKFAVHHLSYDSDEPDNLVSFCLSCHKKTDHSGLRNPYYVPKYTLSVSRGTREKVQAYLAKRQERERYRVTQDLVIEDAINCLEKHDTAGGNGRKK